ncbi:ATP/GTP-binding protein [Thermomonospora echinospora]|uniref:ATP/GTP-binding protein n=1 Tax=Thermomonospora echinospora TaxID=1992 RepID=UPI000CDEE568|nr:ATP/GTP-binding protein [Thermomonospora echinospora]
MSPRRNRRPPRQDGRSYGGGAWSSGLEDREEGPDGEWIVRTIAPANAIKPYRCPGCDHEIAPGIGHVVAWPADRGGPDDRRHWHKPCWRARFQRGPRVQRSRNAPRY